MFIVQKWLRPVIHVISVLIHFTLLFSKMLKRLPIYVLFMSGIAGYQTLDETHN